MFIFWIAAPEAPLPKLSKRETRVMRSSLPNVSRYDTRNYDLVINMDGLTEDDAVEVIMSYIDRTSK